jgi:ABC-type sugar transport system substrate-binding protein
MGAIRKVCFTERHGRIRAGGFVSKRCSWLVSGLGIALLMTLAGCDSLSFTPARPTELATAAEPGRSIPGSTANAVSAKAPKARARLIELIFSQPPDVDRLYLEQFLRRDAGIKKLAFRSVKPEKPEPMSPAALAQAIRAATARGAGAVIVEPIDAPEVRQALGEAEAKGVGIVLLDVAIPSSSPGKSYPRLTFKGFAEGGKKLVEAAIEEAKLLGFPADGTIVVVRNPQKDAYSDQRFDSLISALKSTGRKFEVVSVKAENNQSENVSAFLNTHPDTIALLYDEDYSLAAAHDARRKWVDAGHREIVVAGYTACDNRLDIMVKGKSAALVDRNVEGYTRKALKLALDQIEGKPVPELLEVEMPFTRNRRLFYPAPAEPGKASPAPAAPSASPSGSSKSAE